MFRRHRISAVIALVIYFLSTSLVIGQGKEESSSSSSNSDEGGIPLAAYYNNSTAAASSDDQVFYKFTWWITDEINHKYTACIKCAGNSRPIHYQSSRRSFIDGETKCGDEYWRRVLIGAIAASPNHIDHSSHRKGINFVSSRRIWINFFFISSTFSHHWICSWNLAVPQPLMSFWDLSTRPLSMPKIILVRDFHTPTHFAIIRSRNVDDSEEDLTCYNSDCDYDFPVNRRGLGLERSAVITPERAACIPQPEVRKQWPRQKSTYHANARRDVTARHNQAIKRTGFAKSLQLIAKTNK